MGTIYRVHERNPRLHYYNNTLDYYTLNTEKIFIFYLLKTIEKTSYTHITEGWKIEACLPKSQHLVTKKFKNCTHRAQS
jgi:hypothetical protein